MRQFNLALNASKLETKKLQLQSIEKQYAELAQKLNEVALRFDAKKADVAQLETYILESQTKTV